MQRILTTKDLKARIQELEIETYQREQNLKERWQETYESFKPQNLLKNVVSDVASTPGIKSSLVNTSIGLLTGLLTRKLIAGRSAGIIKNIFATAVQFGVTKMVANKFPAIKEKAQRLFGKEEHVKQNGATYY